MRFLIALALAAAPLAVHAQGLQLWPEPPTLYGEATTSPPTSCTARGELEVCYAFLDTEPNHAPPYLLVHRDGQEIARLPAPPWTTGSTGYLVLQGRLDRDATDDLAIAFHRATSNGLGVSYWTLYILPLNLDGSAGAPLQAETQDFGPDALAGGTVLLTEWRNGPDPSGQRSPGMYFVGRPFRVEGGRLVPATDRPVRARRLLNSFTRPRSPEGHHQPRGWLADRRAETRAQDPALQSLTATPLAEGDVRALERDEDAGRVRLTLRHTDGTPGAVEYALNSWSPGDAAVYFGDPGTMRLYPAEYVPGDLATWLNSRRVRFMEYHDPEVRGTPERVIWVE